MNEWTYGRLRGWLDGWMGVWLKIVELMMLIIGSINNPTATLLLLSMSDMMCKLVPFWILLLFVVCGKGDVFI